MISTSQTNNIKIVTVYPIPNARHRTMIFVANSRQNKGNWLQSLKHPSRFPQYMVVSLTTYGLLECRHD